MSAFTYHYNAMVANGVSIRPLDGLVSRDLPITDPEHYVEIRNMIARGIGVAESRINITSLSLIAWPGLQL